MINKCTNNDQAMILDYIAEDFPKCLYLYLDLIQYGCFSETTRSWIQMQGEKISAVALSYHTALHIFSKDDDLDPNEFCKLIEEINPTIVIATTPTIKILAPVLKNDFQSEFGHIGEWFGDMNTGNGGGVVEADDSDIPYVARLLYEDEDIGASYSYEDLVKQMQERLKEGYVRSYVIRKDNIPVAHVGTGAETNNICTIAYTIVSPDCRGQGLASRLYHQVCSRLKNEGKRIFSVYYPESARLFHHRMGFVDVCECGKLFRIVE